MRELPELPVIKDATIDTLRLEGTLTKRLPSMPSGDLNDLSFTDVRRREAEKYANEMRAAFDISRQQAQRSRAIAKAKIDKRKDKRSADRLRER